MSTIHPDRKKRVRTVLRWFFIAAWVTGVWLLILTTRMIAQYLLGMSIPSWAHYIGQVHGDRKEHTSELQSLYDLVCRLLLEKKKYLN